MSVSKKTFGAVLEEAAKELVNDDVRFAHSIDTSKTVVSEKTLRRVRRQIKNYDTTPVRARTLSFRRAVAAVLVVCILSFSLCLSIDAVREKIFDTLVQWYDKFVSVFYVTEDDPSKVIEEYREPTLELPGVEKEVVFQNERMYRIRYNKNSEIALLFQQMTITERHSAMDNEKCVSEYVEINGNRGQLFLYDSGEVAITWHDEEYRYLIHFFCSQIDKYLIINIAKSVK